MTAAPSRIRSSAAVLTAVAVTSGWWAAPQRNSAEVIAAAVGDMACAEGAGSTAGTEDSPAVCREMAVSDAVLDSHPDVLLALGDEQYERGEPQGWGPYDRSYGRLRQVTRPVPGNHEYLTADAGGYFGYFGDLAGRPDRGYYSFDLGPWHFVALNSECTDVGGCGEASPQLAWLRADLDQHRTRCALAYWHIPRFSSGEHGDHTAYRAMWRTLAAHGVDLVLAGHDHHYERLAAMDADGQADDRIGIRSFIVGTGGRNLRPVTGRHPGSERVIDDAFGFLELRLRADRYAWRFAGPDVGVLDLGESRCH
jgi:acid phosphatase type 7